MTDVAALSCTAVSKRKCDLCSSKH